MARRSKATSVSSIGTSTIFAAWNAAVYVAQIDDERLSAAISGGRRYLDATQEVLQRVTGGLHQCDYKLRCLATDSSGLVHLIVATLPVRNL